MEHDGNRALRARLVVERLQKRFGATRALAGVELVVQPGEVHAVLGENGAGKSTLMGVLAGAVAPDAGSIALDGAPYAPRSPRDARRAGVAVVHQELSLCAHLTVEENVLLGDEPTRFGLVDRRRARERAEAALRRVGARIDPWTRVAELAPAARQLVEIARALAHDRPRVLVLDEPTSSLGRDDAERLLALVRELRDDGMSILYVSHFLEEVEQVADRYTVLRDGATVATGAIEDTSIDELVATMAGRAIERVAERAPRVAGAPILRVEGLASRPRPSDASFVLHRGEVLGIAGLVGAGRTELLRAVFGLEPVVRGTVRVGAHERPFAPHDALARGVGLLSEDRKGEGLALERSVEENLTLSKQPFLIDPERQREVARAWVERLGIKCASVDAPVSSLSGGNQQKVALARLLHHDVDVLLLDEPTRGIDVRSKAQIHALVDRLAREQQKAILVVSSAIPDLLELCDRIAVMRRGVLGPAKPASEWDEHSILREAAVA